MTDIHSCSYYCERPECIKAQRDELRERLAQPEYDYKDLYEKEKRKSAMWLAKYEEIAGPAPKAIPMAQPEQERPIFAEWTSDHVRDNLHKLKPEQEQWDAIPDTFNEWWEADYDDTGNPYRKDSPAYWAWSGWKAASKQPEQEPVACQYAKDVAMPEYRCAGKCQYAHPEQEPVAWEDVLGAIARGWTHDDNKHKPMDVQLAVAIAKEIQDMVIAPPQRKPLTDEEIERACVPLGAAMLSFTEVARAIEAAHGIKENT